MSVRAAQLILGVVIPLFATIAALLPYLASRADLPNHIAVHFTTSRIPTTAMPTSAFLGLATTVMLLGIAACVAAAFKGSHHPLAEWRKLAGSGGFFSAVAATLLGGAMFIHRGLDSWTDTTGPGWAILGVIAAGFGTSIAASKLATIIHGRASP